MNINLKRAALNDAEMLLEMQKKAFKGLFDTYQDVENPYNEPLERVKSRFNQYNSFFYIIQSNDENIGAILVLDNDKTKRLHRLFVLPEYQNNGIAQEAIRQAEEIHGKSNWELDTILQEKGNCHLYEKMGYVQTGKTKVINDKLTLVFYKK